MDSRLYSTTFRIKLKSQWTKTVPQVTICFDDVQIFKGALPESRCFVLESPQVTAGPHRISLEFNNKDHTEQILYGQDMAVVVESVEFENQPTDFGIYSRYEPRYPEDYRRDCSTKGLRLDPIIHSNYLGWDGIWYLDIDLPIFRWIHKTTNLGWLI